MKTDGNMGRFFDWLAKPMKQDDIDAWYLANNIIPEYTELFRDFCISFLNLLNETYLGDNFDNVDTKVIMNEEQNRKHFKWCWEKTIEDFGKENIKIKLEGEHKNYFEDFFKETFYHQKEESVRIAIPDFLDEVFDVERPFSKTDLDLLTELYKLLEKNIE